MAKKSVFLFVTVLVIASTLLAACQPAATAVPTAVPPAATAVPSTAVPPAATAVPQITINYWAFGTEGSTMTGGGLWSDWYANIFKQYQLDHPGVTIDFALKGYDASGMA